jgi:thymidylate synthase ThyX
LISATIIADSSYAGTRLTTLEVIFPRFILPQQNTHRVFSRNTSSSRAIPLNKTIKQVNENPVIPNWTDNQPGMQGLPSSPEKVAIYNKIWLDARNDSVKHASRLQAEGAHKEYANRLLEPFMLTKQLISATLWDNYMNLRIHGDAQNEIRLLAEAIKNQLDTNSPEELKVGEWHLPYILEEERSLALDIQVKISVARCARVSYKTYDTDKLSTVEKDIELYISLLESGHFSPFEHQALISSFNTRSGNFSGNFAQYRKILGN